MKNISFFALLCSLGLWGLSQSACKKEDPAPIITYDTLYTGSPIASDTPHISFVSISPDSVREYIDSIAIVFAYTDGNGNLGENNTSVKNLFIKDLRNNIIYEYRIPDLSPNQTPVSIQGQFTVLISNTIITDGSQAQRLSYELYLKDRAGLTSNTITSTEVWVVK